MDSGWHSFLKSQSGILLPLHTALCWPQNGLSMYITAKILPNHAPHVLKILEWCQEISSQLISFFPYIRWENSKLSTSPTQGFKVKPVRSSPLHPRSFFLSQGGEHVFPYSKTFYFDRNAKILITSRVTTCNEDTKNTFKDMDYLSLCSMLFVDPVSDSSCTPCYGTKGWRRRSPFSSLEQHQDTGGKNKGGHGERRET